MKDDGRRGDLVVLAADQDMVQTVEGLLARPKALKMASVTSEVLRHPLRDSGCRIGAAEFLRPFLGSYRHALVVFDWSGSGTQGTREEIQREVGVELSRNGWDRRAAAIVIKPELEAWVWSTSEHVPRVLGWSEQYKELRVWLREQGLWPAESRKPPDPKEAMRRTMEATHSRKSSRKFFELASKVSLKACGDPSFNDFKRILQTWFPPLAGPGKE